MGCFMCPYKDNCGGFCPEHPKEQEELSKPLKIIDKKTMAKMMDMLICEGHRKHPGTYYEKCDCNSPKRIAKVEKILKQCKEI